MENNDYKNKKPSKDNRPEFPAKAVITGGMPYGNKELHFGHVGGVFVFADTYARFLRDRIGKDNVIFVSGTDCYGSPIAESYRAKVAAGEFDGSIEDFVRKNHESQKKTLDDYNISLNLFGASALGDAAKHHAKVSEELIKRLYDNGQLEKITTSQFFDEKAGVFLNGRQVVGKCPVDGCQSDKAYADECSLGHQYMPSSLIDPKSTLTGETPVMKDVVNWYFRLTDYTKLLTEYVEEIKRQPNVRQLVSKTIGEFLEPPVIHIKKELMEDYEQIKDKLAPHTIENEEKKPSFTICFETLDARDKACEVLAQGGIRFRTGKTLVPFRLTGNIEWGVKAPNIEDLKDLTVWVWPESLWAPISFTVAYLESQGKSIEEWKDYWCSKNARVYQFIGSDNIYFYGVAQTAMFAALQSGEITCDIPDGELQQSTLVANHHILFLDKKASSSGDIKPPMAADLLNYYTAEQLRMHWLSLGLGRGSVSFQPKPYNPAAKPEDNDPVVKEGFLLSNVYNRVIRSCFYCAQKYFDGKMPVGEPDAEVIADSEKAILEYERFMYKFEFHQVTYVLDSYIRKSNKIWAKNMTEADKTDNAELRRQTLINVFHYVRTAAVLLHPLAPVGTEMVREYLGFGEDFWSWDNIFEGMEYFCKGETEHPLKFLEPRVDFFTRHPSQFAEK
ncbi:MAG: class I tRNA ligase family protein [Eubacterium sp.]|nr:class I tRNA ligase family protein [Eubacterium sp.]